MILFQCNAHLSRMQCVYKALISVIGAGQSVTYPLTKTKNFCCISIWFLLLF